MAKNQRVPGYPIAIQVEIMSRFMSEKNLKDFYDEYKTACRKIASRAKPTDSDIRAAAVARDIGNVAAAAVKLGIDRDKLHAIVSRVARHRYYNGA